MYATLDAALATLEEEMLSRPSRARAARVKESSGQHSGQKADRPITTYYLLLTAYYLLLTTYYLLLTTYYCLLLTTYYLLLTTYYLLLTTYY